MVINAGNLTCDKTCRIIDQLSEGLHEDDYMSCNVRSQINRKIWDKVKVCANIQFELSNEIIERGNVSS